MATRVCGVLVQEILRRTKEEEHIGYALEIAETEVVKRVKREVKHMEGPPKTQVYFQVVRCAVLRAARDVCVCCRCLVRVCVVSAPVADQLYDGVAEDGV